MSPTCSHPGPASVKLRGASLVMTQQDTITIPRALGEWLIDRIQSPGARRDVHLERYTPSAAVAVLEEAGEARDPVVAKATEGHALTFDQMGARIKHLERALDTALADKTRAVAALEDKGWAELASRSVEPEKTIAHEVVFRVIIEQPPLTPATTPEENKAFDDR